VATGEHDSKDLFHQRRKSSLLNRQAASEANALFTVDQGRERLILIESQQGASPPKNTAPAFTGGLLPQALALRDHAKPSPISKVSRIHEQATSSSSGINGAKFLASQVDLPIVLSRKIELSICENPRCPHPPGDARWRRGSSEVMWEAMRGSGVGATWERRSGNG
tara:strand:- start:542 stop:1039 length:498 start_codon:yes stop_codon:yes gene_type:complete